MNLFIRCSVLIGNLRGNLIHLFAGNLLWASLKIAVLRMITNATAIIISIMLANGLGAQGYGVYVYAVSLISLLALLNEFGTPTVIQRSAAAHLVQSNWLYLRAMLLRFSQIIVLVTIALSALSLWIVWLVAERLSVHQLHTFLYLLLLLPCIALRKILTEALRGLGYVMASQITGQVIPSVLLLVAISFFSWIGGGVKSPQHAALLSVMVGIVSLCIAGIFLFRRLPTPFWQGTLVYDTQKWVREAVPFILLTGAAFINAKIDIFMLGFFRPVDEIGVYRIAVEASLLVLMGLQIVNTVIAPQITTIYLQNKIQELQKLIRTSARIAFVFALCVSLATFVFGKEIILWLVGDEFADAYATILILNIGTLVAAASGSVVLLAKMTHHEADAMRSLGMSIVLNIILNIGLIPRYGINGAAIATTMSMIFRNVYLYYIIKSSINIKSRIF